MQSMQLWKKLLTYIPVEFSNEKLQIIKGQIPQDLQGVLYRNSVSTKKRNNGYPGHLFDGDGIILKIQFLNGQAIGSYKFVQSQELQQEEQRNEYIYAGLGRTYTGNFLTKIFNSFKFKNSANTSVLPLKNGEIFALWEGGLPTALKKQNLATIGLQNANNLSKSDTFSAHPKVDSKTDLIYNVGILHGMNGFINVYEMNQQGQITKRNQAPMNGQRFMVHDFILAGDYLIVILYSQFITDIHKVFLGRKALGEDVLDDPSKGIQILVFDKSKNLQLVANKINYNQKFNVWHYSNGFIDQDTGNVITQAITYPNYKLFNSFFIDMLLKNGMIDPQSSYDKIIINPQNGEIVYKEQILSDYLEFPIVHDQDVGQQQNFTYALIQERKDDFFNGVIKIDEKNPKNSQRRFYGQGFYLSEALFVQNQAKQKDIGWIIFVVFNGNIDKSTVEILDSESLETVCTLELPQLFGLSFHGRFDYQQC